MPTSFHLFTMGDERNKLLHGGNLHSLSMELSKSASNENGHPGSIHYSSCQDSPSSLSSLPMSYNDKPPSDSSAANDFDELLKKQKKKFINQERASSPPFGIPIEYCKPDTNQPKYKIDWIKCQQQKAKQIIYDDRFLDAIAMVSDGRAQTLVLHGYNMYGEKINVGRNFFDKLLSEDYGMYDWIPKWVQECDSQLYYEIKSSI